MKAILYGIGIQYKMDIRSKTLLITCYLVPLLFFLIMGTIFTSLMPEAKHTLIASMTVMGVSMGAFIGVPPSMLEIYATDIKKMYVANNLPIYFGVLVLIISSFLHLMLMSVIILFTAPILFHAAPPSNLIQYLASLILFILVSLAISCILGLCVKKQAKLTMISQIIFLPSIMLSGIMFPAEFLPVSLASLGKLVPATWGYALLIQENAIHSLLCLTILLILSICISAYLLKKAHYE